jgi:hypothetical protein
MILHALLRNIFLSSIVIMSLYQTCLADNKESNSTQKETPLRSWSITRIAPEKDNYAPQFRKRPSKDEIVCHAGAPIIQTTLLTRPGEVNCVGVLQWQPSGGTVKLNPEGFNYGPIPPINQLSSKEAEILWGPSYSQNAATSERSYKLANDWILDLAFSEDRVRKYRLRSPIFEIYDRLIKADNTRLSDWQSGQ